MSKGHWKGAGKSDTENDCKKGARKRLKMHHKTSEKDSKIGG